MDANQVAQPPPDTLPEQPPTPHIPSDLLSIANAARKLDCTQMTIRKWIRIGLVGYYELVNGQIRVSLSELATRKMKHGDKRFVSYRDAGKRITPKQRRNPETAQRAA